MAEIYAQPFSSSKPWALRQAHGLRFLISRNPVLVEHPSAGPLTGLVQPYLYLTQQHVMAIAASLDGPHFYVLTAEQPVDPDKPMPSVVGIGRISCGVEVGLGSDQSIRGCQLDYRLDTGIEALEVYEAAARAMVGAHAAYQEIDHLPHAGFTSQSPLFFASSYLDVASLTVQRS